MDWFLDDRDLCYKSVKLIAKLNKSVKLITMCEKCQNTKFFVDIFQYSDKIRRIDTSW